MKPIINSLFFNVKTGKAFISLAGGYHISLKNPITPASHERLSNLSYSPKFKTHYMPDYVVIDRV